MGVGLGVAALAGATAWRRYLSAERQVVPRASVLAPTTNDAFWSFPVSRILAAASEYSSAVVAPGNKRLSSGDKIRMSG